MSATARKSDYIGFWVIGEALAPRDNLTSGPISGFPFGRASPGDRASGDHTMPTKFRQIPPETVQAFSMLVNIDPDTGSVTWKSKKANRKAGAEVGMTTDEGYRRTAFNGHYFYVHRFLWTYANGPIPEGYELDHINGNRGDNRISNLRLCTTKQNKQNRHGTSKNKKSSGALGATWNSRQRKWKTQIKLDSKTTHLGYYDTAEEAHAVYMAAKRKLHEFNTL